MDGKDNGYRLIGKGVSDTCQRVRFPREAGEGGVRQVERKREFRRGEAGWGFRLSRPSSGIGWGVDEIGIRLQKAVAGTDLRDLRSHV